MTISRMNFWYLAAGGMMLSCAAIHAFLGGPEINAPVQASVLAPELKAVLAVIWHALTGLFLVFGVALGWAAIRDTPAVIWTILAVCVFFAALFIGIGITALGSVTIMPQWVIFSAISVCLLAGMTRPRLLAITAG